MFGTVSIRYFTRSILSLNTAARNALSPYLFLEFSKFGNASKMRLN